MNTAKKDTPVCLTGIKPTGTPHLGNYFSAILPAIKLSKLYRCYFFIANYHALNAAPNKEKLERETLEIAACWLACGLDPKEVLFYKQSDILEIFELMVILTSYTPKGLMNRSHAYKAKVQENAKLGRDADATVNMGLFNYPVLMAADILLFKADVVPIGHDQLQHLEVTNDIAQAFNNATQSTLLTLPRPLLSKNTETIKGIDGRKMSKSYGNTIPIFQSKAKLRQAVMSIVTTSQTVAEPKDPDSCLIFSLYKLFSTAAEQGTLRKRYLEGGMGWGEAKEALLEKILSRFHKERMRYDEFIMNPDFLQKTLATGAKKAREHAALFMHELRSTLGIA